MVFLGVLRPRLKKRLWHRCFPVNFVKFLRTSFFAEHLRWLILVITVNLLLTSRIVKMWFRTYNKNLLNGISCCCSDLSYIYWLIHFKFQIAPRPSLASKLPLTFLLEQSSIDISPTQWIWSFHYLLLFVDKLHEIASAWSQDWFVLFVT